MATALGSKRAAGWQSLYLYHAYRLEQAVLQPNDRTIATGCQGATTGPCDFVEFITYIDSNRVKRNVNGVRIDYGRLNEDDLP
jgi:hypothetical protein